MRKWPVADPRDSRVGPLAVRRRAGKGDEVERQRHLANHALDLLRIRQARDEEAAGARIRKGFSTLDDLVDQRIVIGLRLQEQVGSRIDETIAADGAPDCPQPGALPVERMKPLAADYLVFEIAPDDAGRLQPRGIR